ncbi:MAG: filamentous hemagglutinin N-terminal domain-containing protein, partial [Rhodobiaceae bacterium]|nr:filamentous hemagglutinin N-terminal domain-containing protein [Rhodobiaceae bacterium]
MKIRPSKSPNAVGNPRKLSHSLLWVAAFACMTTVVQAEPSNGTIVAGGGAGASIGSVANAGGGFDVTVQQNSGQMVVTWDDFNINANDVVNFIQPSSSAIAVNKVVGGLVTPTMIDGTLSSNGHVWILDPAGIAFGAGAVVDVGGLLATTSTIDTATFMATDPTTGTFVFTNDGAGSITNAADLKAQGLIALVAPVVTNSASVTSENGDVLLGGAKAFRLKFAEVDRTPAGGGAAYKELLVTDFIIDTGVDNAMAPAETVPVTQTATGSARGSNIIISAASAGGGAFLNVDGIVEATNVGTGSGSVALLGGANLVGGVVAATGTETIRTADLGVSATGGLTIQGGAVSIASSAQDVSVASATITAVTGDATVNDAIVATTGAIDITASSGNIDAAALTAGTTITMTGQDIDLAGKVDATTTAMLTATTGNVSSTGALEIEGSAGKGPGPILVATGAPIQTTGPRGR